MNGAIRIILVTGVLVVTVLALLTIFNFISIQTLIDSAGYLALALGVFVACTVAIHFLSRGKSEERSSDESHIR